jgi:CBS domain-containing protein
MAEAITGRAGSPYRVPRFEHALVSEAMRPEVITCPSDAPLRMVAETMAAEHVHCVVITPRDGDSSQGREWSVVSDLDLVGVAGSDMESRTAGWAAASDFLTVAPDERLERAAQIMTEHEVTHVIVVASESERPVGVLSTLDVAGVLAWGRD